MNLLEPSTPKFGFEQESSILKTLYQEMLMGNGKIVCIGGDPGSGKTTLVEDFISKLPQTVEIRVTNCRSFIGNESSYGPFIELLGDLVEDKKDKEKQTIKAIKELGPDWISLIPVLGSAIGAVWKTVDYIFKKSASDNPSDLEIDQRHSMMDRYVNFILAHSINSPIIFFIDDIHWIDTLSAELLFRFAKKITSGKILIICTYRPTEIVSNSGEIHPASRVFYDLKALNLFNGFEIDFLRINETKELIAHNYPGIELIENFVDWVQFLTGGLPLFIKQYLEYLRDSDVIFPNQSEFGLRGEVKFKDNDWVCSGKLSEIALPNTLEAVINLRISALKEEDKRILMRASVLGDTFYSLILAKLLESNEIDILDKLSFISQFHNLVDFVGSNEETFISGTEALKFLHAVVQQLLYQDMQSTQRRQLHLMCGEALEISLSNSGLSNPSWMAELKNHFQLGGDYLKAANYSLELAKYYLRAYSADDAIVQCNDGLSFIKNIIGEDKNTLDTNLNIMMILCESYRILGLKEEEDKLLKELIDLSSSEKLDWKIRFSIYLLNSKAGIDRSNYEQAYSNASLALEISLNFDDLPLQAICYDALGLTKQIISQFGIAEEHFNSAIKIQEKTGDTRGMIISQIHLVANFMFMNKLISAEELVETISNTLKNENIDELLPELLTVKHKLYSVQCKYSEAIQIGKETRGLLRDFNDVVTESDLIRRSGWLYVFLGEWEKAKTIINEGIKLSQRIGYLTNEGWGYWYLGAIDIFTNKISANTLKNLETACSIGDRIGDVRLQIDSRNYKARYHILENDDENLATAKALILEAEKLSEDNSLIEGKIRCFSLKAEINLLSGNFPLGITNARKSVDLLKSVDDVDLPEEEIYYILAYALQSNGDIDEGESIYLEIYQNLMKKASMITELKLRDSFLNIPINQRIIRTWEKLKK